MYKKLEDIQKLDRSELIEYAKDINIFKVYDNLQYVETRNNILDRMKHLGIELNEVYPVRQATPDLKIRILRG